MAAETIKYWYFCSRRIPRTNVMVSQGSLAPASTSLEDGRRQASQSSSLFYLLDDVQLSRLLRILISQRWPFSSVRSKRELMLSVSRALLVKPLRIGELRDLIGVITDHLQLILRERCRVRLQSLA